MALITLPANNLQIGSNILKVWGKGPEPGIIKGVRVVRSVEAGTLRSVFDANGALISTPGALNNINSFSAAEQATITLIHQHAEDNVMTAMEKSVWRTSMQNLTANYNTAVIYTRSILTAGDPAELTTLISAYGDLNGLLITYGVFDPAGRKNVSPISGSELETRYVAYSDAYQALSELMTGVVAEKKAAEGGETNVSAVLTGWGWKVPGKTTIDGNYLETGSIKAGSILAGEIKGYHVEAESIDATKIAANAIEATHIKADAIEAEHIKAGAIHADIITGDVIKALPFSNTNMNVSIPEGTATIEASYILPGGTLDKTPHVSLTVQCNNGPSGGMGSAKIMITLSDGVSSYYNEYHFLIYGAGTGVAVMTAPWATTQNITATFSIYNHNAGDLILDNLNGVILGLR